eukprot:gene48545-41330_t
MAAPAAAAEHVDAEGAPCGQLALLQGRWRCGDGRVWEVRGDVVVGGGSSHTVTVDADGKVVFDGARVVTATAQGCVRWDDGDVWHS